jgi:hypothetical protein
VLLNPVLSNTVPPNPVLSKAVPPNPVLSKAAMSKVPAS